ncbi:MAG: hypothetical protein IT355_12140 [Gemmatimonadaceae bacterium]|nr:hypothetical protein [Gemmatimonadaceae bacterium]
MAAVPVGIGARLPELAEAADLTLVQATVAIQHLEVRRQVSCASRLLGGVTHLLYARTAA